MPLEARKRELGTLLRFSSAVRWLLALITAAPLAPSVIKCTARAGYGAKCCPIRADSIPATILIPLDGKKSPGLRQAQGLDALNEIR